MMTDVRVQQAREFASMAHGGQIYKDTPGDYVIEHLDVVASLVAPYGTEDQVVAYLHDVLEDTACTKEDLIQIFGVEVARHTQLVTDEIGSNRRERKELANRKLAAVEETDFRALRVKAADRLANIRTAALRRPDLLKMYRKEHEAFRAAVYRIGIAEELWAEMDSIVGSEYH